MRLPRHTYARYARAAACLLLLLGQLVVASIGASPASAEPSMANGLAEPQSGFVRVYAGDFHAMGIKADGTVWAWGRNQSGQLGDGTTIDRSTPVQIPSLTGTRQLALGGSHSLALKADGTVWAWGLNSSGELGDGTTIDHSNPAEIASLAGARQVAAGFNHSAVIASDGKVWLWGSNQYGKLGDGTTIQRASPVAIPSLAGARQVVLGGNHSMAILADGSVWGWGLNLQGQLGDGTTTDRSSPVQSMALAGTGTRQLALGSSFSMAIGGNGIVRSWGANFTGQLGDGSTTNRSTPTSIGALAGARQIAAGRLHAMAILPDGSLYAWGSNAAGGLGDGTTTTRTSPVPVSTLTTVLYIAAGSESSFTYTTSGGFFGWGTNLLGQLGDGTTTSRTTPTASLFVPGCGFVAVYPGPNHTFAIKADRTVWAWGANGNGELGDGTTTSRSTPVLIPALFGARMLAAGTGSSAAIMDDGRLLTWGSNFSGQLGDGTTTNNLTPTAVASIPRARSIVVNLTSAYAILPDGVVRVWGNNLNGRLGDGTTTTRLSPVTIVSLMGAREIVPGDVFGMAISGTGAVLAWGSNGNGQFGDGTTVSNYTPAAIPALAGAMQLALGADHAGAIFSNGSVQTWGRNNNGQLGDGTTTSRLVPGEIVSLLGSRWIAASDNFMMSIGAGGNVGAWGYNFFGQLGDGTTTNRLAPVPIAGLAGSRALSTSPVTAFSVGSGGVLLGWGRNVSGQLGDGSTVSRSSPVVVDNGCAQAPNKPVNVAPVSGTTLALPTLSGSAFSDPNVGDTHIMSQWQVRTDAGSYVASFEDSGVTGAALTSWGMSNALTVGSKYWFQVRYQDSTGLWSMYSNETAFVYDPNPPLASVLVSPVDLANVTSSVLTASYVDSAPASDGRVEFQVCSTNSCAVVLQSGLSPVTVSGANGSWSHTRPSGSYFWRARSVDAAGSTGPWTGAWSFVYAQAPVTPSLVSPSSGAWVATATPTLTATYSDPDGDAGVDVFQLCRTNAGATDWSNVANCASGFSTVASATGASGVNKSAVVSTVLGQGAWYWRASSRDVGGGSSAFSTTVRLLQVDTLPPATLTGIIIRRSGLGKITASWNATTDAGIGGVIVYDMEGSADGTSWSSVCAASTALSCEKSGLGGGSLPFVRVRACDSLGNCTTWQGRTGGSAVGYYLRTSVNSTILTNAANKQATVASGTANSTTANRVDSGDVGWLQLYPNALNSTAPAASEPAGVPAPATGRGWIIDSTASRSYATGTWSADITTEATVTVGVALIQCRAWVVTVAGASITASSNYQSAYTSSADVMELGQQTSTCVLPGFAVQTTLAANQYIYLELYSNTTSAASSNNQRLRLWAEGTGSALSIPTPGTAPNTPTITAPANNALTDPTIDFTVGYSHPVATQGTLEYEVATDAGFTNVVQGGTSALLTSPSTPTFTTESIPSGTYFWRVRAVDTAGLVSAFTASRTIVVSTAPATPTHVSPADGATTGIPGQVLQASAFSDPNTGLGDTHALSQWQIVLAGAEWSTGQDSGWSAAALTSWTPPVALVPGETYQWRVRYQDAYGERSAYSTQTTFTVASGGSVTLALSAASVDLGTQTYGVDRFASIDATIVTTNPTGYKLSVTGVAAGTDGTTCGGCTNPIKDWTGTDAVPVAWGTGSYGTDGYFGLTVRGATGTRLVKWGAGTGWPETDVTNNRYAAVSTTPLTLHQTGTTTAGDVITSTIRIDISPTTSGGTHNETLIYSAVANA